MKEMIKKIIQVAHVLSFSGVIFSGGLGAVCEIIGYAKFEQVLSAIGISKGFDRYWLVSVIMLLLLISTYFIKAKLFS